MSATIQRLPQVACFLALAAGTALAQFEDLPSRAKALVMEMAAQHLDKVEAKFDSTLASALPPSKLSAAWDAALSQVGDFQSIAETREEESQGYRIVYVTCQFAKRKLDLKVVFDAKGQVGGLLFTPTRSHFSPEKHGEGSASPADMAGDWFGSLDLGALKLRIVFHITASPEGLVATMDSPDQNANGLRVKSVQVSGSSVELQLPKFNVVYEGKLSADLSTLDGTWKQGMGERPLVLKRVKDQVELTRSRPQEPQKPYPYREEDVSYENKLQGDKLAATLTIPPGNGPFPAVVLITGSGPQDRDETVFGHKPFLILSDYLTRKGVAVLRTDDRGIGKSTGEFSGATTADFATDTEAGIAYLQTRSEVNTKMIGLIGHSEGGIIASMIAARNRDVAFIVMLAGTGVPGDQITVAQTELIEEATGKSHEEAMKAGERQREIMELVKENADDALIEKQLREEVGAEMSKAQIGALIKQLNLPWFRFFINYDPAQALRKVTCPVLALNGEKDLQVPPQQNLPAIRKALEAGGNKNFEIDELPGLNHLFQTAKTGSPLEYAQIEETMSPAVLNKVADWILKVTRAQHQATAATN